MLVRELHACGNSNEIFPADFDNSWGSPKQQEQRRLDVEDTTCR
jgi:hypothetical protein